MIEYVEGPLGSGKTSRLLAETNRLLNMVPASSVLILCSNHSRQTAFIDRLLAARSEPLAQVPVYTYAGFVRNALFDYWPLAEARIAASLKAGKTSIRPELSGMEDSELMLRWLLRQLREEATRNGGGEPYRDFPGDDRQVLRQLIRRLRLRSENQLTRPEMNERSELLNEPCRPETAWLEQRFDRISYLLRVLDPNKQLDIFHGLLRQENPLSSGLKRDLRHLIVDDVDETIPAQQRFIEWLAPGLDTFILAADPDGGSRRGYLNAYPYDWQALKNLRSGKTATLMREDDFYRAGQILLANWKQPGHSSEAVQAVPQTHSPGRFQVLPPVVRIIEPFMTRVEMLDRVVEELFSRLENGASPGDFCLVAPKADFLTFHRLERRLQSYGLPVQLLSGTKRPSDNPRCRGFIALLQWANSGAWQAPLSPWEIKTVLTQVLRARYWSGLSEENLDTLIRTLHDSLLRNDGSQGLPSLDDLPIRLEGKAREEYATLADWLIKATALPFDQQLYSAFKDVLAVFSDEKSAYGDLNRIIQSYLRQREIYRGFFGENGNGSGDFDRWWLTQVKTSAVADTPDVPEAVRADALVIGTPQKIIDAEVYRSVQIWLDVGSREWARSDNAPLYNAWVHSAVWDGSNVAFSEEFNEAVIRTRAGHITRTLMLLATGEILAYASELDDFGFAQTGLLPSRLLVSPPQAQPVQPERAVLRPDQAPVLAYRAGTLAISAVPGAGKTFVNVELLLELIAQGVEPDRILVLTYMDSAAKTLLGRLKKKLAGMTPKLPVISTIHSLALRILMENDHALLLGSLPDDLTILDEATQAEILAPIAAATLPESIKDAITWQKMLKTAIGHTKTFGLSVETIREQHRRMPECFRLAEFLPALEAYGEALHRTGGVDFTDLILNAVRILKEYPDIRETYRQRFQYIIEDEAQDSSRLLQDFIHLLGGEQPNLIRTGDTNQSITTTFSSAEPAVFRDFIRQADQRVHMDHSGRCAPEIITLANFWMSAAGRQPGLERAFEPVNMRPVPGKNPTLIEPPDTRLFETERWEETWLVERIAAFRRENPEASVAVLVRGNHQVNRVTGLLQGAGLRAVGLSDALNAHPVFKGILACLRLLAEPGDLVIQGEWSRWMAEAGLLPENADVLAFLNATPLLYAHPAMLADETLRQWHYDLLDFSRQAVGGNIGALIARIADRLYPETGDRSNGYLCALMAGEILEETRRNSSEIFERSSQTGRLEDGLCFSPLDIVIRRFEAFQRSWRGRKGFTDVLTRQAEQVVQVMTLHKSKGQEFDIVFIPFLQADAFRHDMNTVRFDETDKLLRDLDRVAARVAGVEPPIDYTEAKKREKIEEEARLIYVGLTRARRALFLSAHRQSQKAGKPRPSEPALAFRLLAEHLTETNAGQRIGAEKEA